MKESSREQVITSFVLIVISEMLRRLPHYAHEHSEALIDDSGHLYGGNAVFDLAEASLKNMREEMEKQRASQS